MQDNYNNSKSVEPEILGQIKQELLASKAKILEELETVKGSEHKSLDRRAKFPEFGDKPDDNAQEIDSYTTNLATEKILEDSLRDIDNALKRIEEGSYGICKYCGLPINPKRLVARPVASACIECKSKLQQG